ncbi:MAG: hypothetical protein KAK00_11025 [Nanoarchaeota archaeon]|nr:hypothetical protein [Nanoarchaeota archaeon]
MLRNKINVLESVLSVKGRIFWNDNRRRIDLKKPIRDIFEPLEKTQARVLYNMELCLSKKKLMQRTEELLNEGVIPILFYFTKESLMENEENATR